MRRIATLITGILTISAAAACGDDELSVPNDAGSDTADSSTDAADASLDASEPADDADSSDAPGAAGIRFNELVASPLANAADWIELYNPSDEAFDLAGWSVTDSDPEQQYIFPAGSSVPAAGYLVVERDAPGSFTFGLGEEDGLFLYDVTDTLVDAVSWLAGDAPAGRSYGRIPDGSGAFRTLNVPTPGAPNVDNNQPECGNGVIDTGEVCDGSNFVPYSCTTYGLGDGSLACRQACGVVNTSGCSGAGSPVVINEVRSTVDDGIELFNRGAEVVDLAGWVIGDDDPDHRYVLPGGTTLAAGAYLVLVQGTDHAFGIGSDDAVELFDDQAQRRDAVDWLDNEALVSYCRRPNGTGAFGVCEAATFGAANGD